MSNYQELKQAALQTGAMQTLYKPAQSGGYYMHATKAQKQYVWKCEKCSGTGVRHNKPCSSCKGERVMEKTKKAH